MVAAIVTDPHRPQLLMLCYACSPYHGSEPSSGWNRAIEAAKDVDTWVICDGPECGECIERYERTHGPIDGLKFTYIYQPRWQRRLAQRLGVADRVERPGEIPHAEALEQYKRADVFAFTSLCDTTGMVVVAAFAAGLPVVAFDHQGAGDMVTEACGIKIPLTTPSQAIRRLATDGALRERLSRGACQRAGQYKWRQSTRRTEEIYFRALGVDRREAVAMAPNKSLPSSSYA
jgi:glycosyltransferase involved in cell wall biosynthesis